ncbi:hypothetical protein NP233_g3326 [Leucocoprinus birnbaumii]|uniref:C2H2-type domain-containing protein n=1 Tax=Leucocoprinus birnbaumii TaxID=56174 RepID=A0AAD5VWP8_9AGAR|nr:hypothetical protein NP233_g3326 [Leucocoprinus birnbaumii]
MQAQYNIAPPPSIGYYHHHHSIAAPYSTVHDQYFATGGDDFSGSFSSGSSLAYPHEDYRYMTDRGGPSSAVPTAAVVLSSAPVYTQANIPFDATCLGYPESNNNVAAREPYCHAEDISASYEQSQGWQWECHSSTAPGQATVAPSSHPHPHPLAHPQLHASVLPQLPGVTDNGSAGRLPPDSTFLDLSSTIKSSAVTVGQSQNYHPVRSPTAQLPTPAAMAVLLNPNGHGRSQTPQGTMDPVGLSAQQPTPAVIQMPSSVTDANALMPVPDILSREKKHACTMCHKRFDRPSTLRKHLLVHTGEKAFVCDTCGRRFGVASNLNRHVRRCILKPVNAAAAATSSSSSSTSPSTSGSGTLSDMSPDNDNSTPKASGPKRGRALSTTGSTSSSSSISSSNPSPTHKGTAEGKPPGQKRRRRAPSPSLWIPWSLRAFNLACEEFYRSAPVPLQPVKRNLPREERDSYDENVTARPYHPIEWKGVLPGPGLGPGLGLGGKDVRNLNFGGSGGIMLGRVLVF